MYIRRTSIKSRKDGSKYYTYRLVESRRTDKGVRQHTLINLGHAFALPREQWPELANRIDQILTGQQGLFAQPQEIEQLAQHYAALIIQAQQQTGSGEEKKDFQKVNLDTLELTKSRSVGKEHVALEALRGLKITQKLKELDFSGPQIAAAIGTIIGRMCMPGSELATHHWLQENTGLGELIGFDFGKTSLYQMYKTSDHLIQHKEELEAHLFKQEQRLFGLKETITLYDLTNTYFEGSCKANSLAAYGHSKEKRSDCPLVTLALVLDSSGFPKASKIFEGNVSEPGTLAEMLEGIQAMPHPRLFDQEKATVVMDAGIATEDNVAWLKEHKYPYIVVSRKRHREFDKEQAVIVKEDNVCTVKANKVTDPETGEVLLYCHSTMREKKEQAIQNRFTKRFEESLQKLAAGLHKKRCLKKYDKVQQRIGALKKKFSLASKQYKIEVKKDDKSGNAVEITWQHQPAPNTTNTLPGVYCLRTSHAGWDEENLWNTYTMLTDLESVFRSLKTELGLRPVYHRKTDRVTGHLFITVLAYHLVHSIRYRLKEADITTSWEGLRSQLENQHRVTVSMQHRNGDMIHVRKSTSPSAQQQHIYKALGMPLRPGKTEKTIIAAK